MGKVQRNPNLSDLPSAYRKSIDGITPQLLSLWLKFKADGDKSAFDALVAHYLPRIGREALRLYYRKPELFTDVDDLLSDGSITLMSLLETAEVLDLDDCFRFIGLLKLRFSSRAHSFAAERRWGSYSRSHRQSLVRRKRAELTQELGRTPSDEEMTDALVGIIGNPAFHATHTANVQSFSDCALSQPRKAARRQVSPRFDEPDARAMEKEFMSLALQGFKGEDRKMLKDIFSGIAVKEIAKKYGMSEAGAHSRCNGMCWELRARARLASYLGVIPEPKPLSKNGTWRAISTAPPAQLRIAA